jgi:methyltransferase (TIGR00027 family)
MKKNVQVNLVERSDNDIVESASVTALMRYLLSNKEGRGQNPDNLGNMFVNGKWRKYLESPEDSIKELEKKLPGTIFYHLIRTKHFDKSLLRWIDKNPNSQVVIVGAGYDTRAIRFEKKIIDTNVDVYEVDLPALLEYKNKTITSNLQKYVNRVKLTPCNFQTGSLLDALKSNGFNTDKPTYFLCEGITYFLTEQCITNIFESIKSNMRSSVQIVFDYDFKDFVGGNVSFYGAPELYRLTNDIGEPHLFGLNYDDVDDFCTSLGFKVKSNYTSFMLESLYLRDGMGISIGRPHGFIGITEITVNE